jgi:hypothetical protein
MQYLLLSKITHQSSYVSNMPRLVAFEVVLYKTVLFANSSMNNTDYYFS